MIIVIIQVKIEVLHLAYIIQSIIYQEIPLAFHN